jgi:uncharacterized protein YhfF
MNEKDMWNVYIKNNDVENKSYDAWSFGGGSLMANKLATLVIKGIKTATTSAYQLYELENTPLPPIGGLNIILDADNNAVCITETTKVYTCPFLEVSEEHALKEGEGDKSISYWRKVHKDFFSREIKAYDLDFDDKMLVVCEEFRVVFK